jgi:2-polyprenyl-3-methyl-5-hydroxy-6-metoxy-1,4-benzoquinol methylase
MDVWLTEAKLRFKSMESELLEKYGFARIEETTFPVYANSNGLASWLAWRRIYWAQALIAETMPPPVESVIDFGCGLGPMLPFLFAHSRHLVGVDIDVEVSAFAAARMGVDVNIENSIANMPKSSVDLIVALDVLEHVPDLASVIAQFREVLRPGGSVVVSGPTEGRFYRIARTVARTRGDGHVRTIDEIVDDFTVAGFAISRTVVIPFRLPLFRIFRAGLVDV